MRYLGNVLVNFHFLSTLYWNKEVFHAWFIAIKFSHSGGGESKTSLNLNGLTTGVDMEYDNISSKLNGSLNLNHTPTSPASKLAEMDSSTIIRQRKELQLMISELKDRDKELNELVQSHHKQVWAGPHWNYINPCLPKQKSSKHLGCSILDVMVNCVGTERSLSSFSFNRRFAIWFYLVSAIGKNTVLLNIWRFDPANWFQTMWKILIKGINAMIPWTNFKNPLN